MWGMALIVVGAVIGSLDVVAPGLFVTGLGLIAWWPRPDNRQSF